MPHVLRQLVRAVITQSLAQRGAHHPVTHDYTFTFSDRSDDAPIVGTSWSTVFLQVFSSGEAMRLVVSTIAKIATAGARVQGNLATAL